MYFSSQKVRKCSTLVLSTFRISLRAVGSSTTSSLSKPACTQFKGLVLHRKIPFFMEDVKLHNLQYCHIHYTGLYCHVFQLSPIIGVGQSDSLRASFLNIHIFCVLLNKYWRRAIFQHYPHIQLRELYVPGHFFSKGLLQCLPK